MKEDCYIVTTAITEEEIEDLRHYLKNRYNLSGEDLNYLEFRPASNDEQTAFLPKMVVGDNECVGWGMVINFLQSHKLKEAL